MAKRGRKVKPAIMPSVRNCCQCGLKPITDFYIRKKGLDGSLLSHYANVCKMCSNQIVINNERRKRLRTLTIAELATEYTKTVEIAKAIKAAMAEKMNLEETP